MFSFVTWHNVGQSSIIAVCGIFGGICGQWLNSNISIYSCTCTCMSTRHWTVEMRMGNSRPGLFD